MRKDSHLRVPPFGYVKHLRMNVAAPRSSCRSTTGTQCPHGVVKRGQGIAFVAMVLLAPLISVPLSRAALSAELGWPWKNYATPLESPHPSVARIIVNETGGQSLGTGTLVSVRGNMGMVVTNWHVVRDATGSIHAEFSDGFRSAARVIHTDRDWDLAALLIWRPGAAPVELASRAPAPGDVLTIAGYGAGRYRSATGRCTQYVAPSEHHAFEMVEVGVEARQGDSGGPIFNTNGQLAGVLFGSGNGVTAGSYAGRVHRFLQAAWPEPPPTVASSETEGTGFTPPLDRNHPPIAASTDERPTARLVPLPESAIAESYGSGEPAEHATRRVTMPEESATARIYSSHDGSSPPPDAERPSPTASGWQDLVGQTPWDLFKTVLAAVGFLTVVSQFAGGKARAESDE